jgi:hypothetical protein
MFYNIGPRLGEVSPFGLLFKGPGKFLGEHMVCYKYFKSLKVFDVVVLYFQMLL